MKKDNVYYSSLDLPRERVDLRVDVYMDNYPPTPSAICDKYSNLCQQNQSIPILWNAKMSIFPVVHYYKIITGDFYFLYHGKDYKINNFYKNLVADDIINKINTFARMGFEHVHIVERTNNGGQREIAIFGTHTDEISVTYSFYNGPSMNSEVAKAINDVSKREVVLECSSHTEVCVIDGQNIVFPLKENINNKLEVVFDNLVGNKTPVYEVEKDHRIEIPLLYSVDKNSAKKAIGDKLIELIKLGYKIFIIPYKESTTGIMFGILGSTDINDNCVFINTPSWMDTVIEDIRNISIISDKSSLVSSKYVFVDEHGKNNLEQSNIGLTISSNSIAYNDCTKITSICNSTVQMDKFNEIISSILECKTHSELDCAERRARGFGTIEQYVTIQKTIITIRQNIDKRILEDIKNNPEGFKYINNTSEENKLMAVNNNSLSIKFFENTSEELHLAAVKEDGYAIKYIENPSEEVQLAAVNNNGLVIKYIENPS